jgi:acyl transferase domain-containing protein/acyl-CoA synthetase (AMP-forming)/AMP-acid ligase II/acyl carrier protein
MPDSPSRNGHAATLVDLVHHRACEEPDATALTFLEDGENREEILTYGELERVARCVAARLHADGVTAGARALLLYPPGLDYIAAFFGCLQAGVIAVPAYPPLLNRPSSQLATFVENATPTTALTTNAILALREKLTAQEPSLGELQWLATDAIEEGAERDWSPPRIRPETTAFIQYSSGSTAKPKGVVLSHENLLVNTNTMCERADLGENTRTVSWLPPYHDAGLIGKILTPLVGGFPGVLMSPIAFLQEPVRWLRAIERYSATCSAAPNFGYELCIRKTTPEQRAALDLSSWRRAMNTGEPVRADTLRRFAEAFAPAGFRYESFYPCYGLAESTVMVGGPEPAVAPRVIALDREALQDGAVVPAADVRRAHELVACGHSLPGHRVAIVEPETRKPLEEREIGEIWVHGPSVAQGYWNQPEATEENFHARLADGDLTSYMRTGDLGFLDGGEIHIAGRAKDVIVVRGRNHYSQDIERTAEQASPALRPGCGAAFGLEQDGEERLVLVNEVDRQRLGDVDSVLETVAQAILGQHGVQPDGVVLIERGAMPKTSSGKQRRQEARARLLARELPVVAEWRPPRPRAPASAEAPGGKHEVPNRSRPAIQRWLVDRLAREAGIDTGEIDHEMPFAALGIDSVRAVELVSELSTWLGRQVPETAPWDHPTIARLSRYLAGEFGERPPSPERPAATDEPLAVVGMSCRFPGAPTLDAFRVMLRNGIDGTDEVPPDRWAATREGIATARGGFVEGIDLFDAAFFGIAPAEAASIDPQQRLLLEVAWEAFEHAAQSPDELGGSATGVFVGIGTADYFHLQAELGALTAHSATGTAHSIAANRLSYALDLRGPSVAVDTACSSSLVALDLACRSLRSGESDMTIVGGVNLMLTPHLTVALSRSGMLAPDGRCKAFDAAADGYARGEGCGVVVLERLSDALRRGARVHALVRGSAVRQDGRTSGLSAPSGEAQQAVVKQAFTEAGVAPVDVDYVEAHGTGTALGDPIEIAALAGALGSPDDGEVCNVGSVKANVGHLEAGAGIAGFIKVVLALAHRELYPQPNFEQLNPRIDLEGTRLKVSTELRRWAARRRPRIAGVSSFGFGGTIAHAVLEEAAEPTRRPSRRERPWHVVTLSAHSDTARRELAVRTAQHIERSKGKTPLPDLAHTLNTGRARLPWRLAVRARSSAELRERLKDFGAGEPDAVACNAVSRGHRPAVAFVFSGQGAQHPRMAETLYATSPTFRGALDQCAEILDGHLDRPLAEVLFGRTQDESIHRTEFAQPALVAVEISLARLWSSWGIVPDVVTGHSVGEIAAAHVAGALTLGDALTFAAERGRLMQTLPAGGAMAAIMARSEVVREAIAGQEGEVAIAAENGPESVTISGRADAVGELVDSFKSRGVTATHLEVSHAFHSPLIAPILEPLERAASRCRITTPTVPMVGGVTGEVVDEKMLGPAYWRLQAQSPVLFGRALCTLEAVLGQSNPGGQVFLEMGPRPVLLGFARRALDPDEKTFLATLRPGQRDWPALLDSLVSLHLLGSPVDWRGFDRDYRRNVVSAPTYPFERRRHWITPVEGSSSATSAPASSLDGADPSLTARPVPTPPSRGEALPELPAREEILSRSDGERRALLEGYLRAELARVIGVPTRLLDVRQPLRDSGLDSIMLLDVRHRIEHALNVPLPTVSIAEGATVAEFAEGLAELLESTEDQAPDGAQTGHLPAGAGGVSR